VTFAVAFLPLLLLHVIVRWPRVRARRPDFASRRAVLRYGALSAIGLVLWRTSEMASQSADWTGSQRRFTGSREISSLSGNGFPATNWFSDPKPDIAPEAWSLRIYGEVHVETNLTITSLEAFAPATVRAPLDCTGGWFTDQVWTGYPVSALLLAAGASSDARSVVFHSVTGYARRYALDGAERLLLATRVGDEPLTRGHGYPLRLIAPGRRGFGWVKWVVAIEVSALPGWFQSPLPLQ
jgi:DMSO/TMAO reductase YedYZ molybdopterin-dependent catalytic subunit